LQKANKLIGLPILIAISGLAFAATRLKQGFTKIPITSRVGDMTLQGRIMCGL